MSINKAKKNAQGSPYGEVEEDRRQPSQRKKKHKSKTKRRKSHDFDDEY